jgi:transposase
MSLKPVPIQPVPEGTARVAKAAFRKGTPLLKLRDELGAIFADGDFADLFPRLGQPGLPPWRLALVTLLQFRENLPDRQAAEAVRARIDWKYLLERSARKLGCLYPHERAEVSMAGSYSTDLRERVLAAVGAGATPEAAARRFAVGRSTAYRWATAARLEGRRAAKRMGGGPKPRITGEVEAALLDLLREANHLTLAECRDRLAERTGVRVHPWTVGRALRRCGWT